MPSTTYAMQLLSLVQLLWVATAMLWPFTGGLPINNGTEINILFLQSTDSEFESSTSLAAVQTAVEDVNMNSEILPGYSLRLLTVLGSSATDLENGSTASFTFFEALFQVPTPLAVLGAASVEDTTFAAKSTTYFQMNMVTLSLACLAENVDLPNHFCMLPSKEHLGYGIAGLIVHFGWQRATIITENGNPFVLAPDHLVKPLQANNVTVTVEYLLSPQDYNRTKIRSLLVPDVHIFILNTSPDQAILILCEALHEGRGYPNYVWITPGWYPERWWEQASNNTATTACLQEDLIDFLHGTIVISHFPTTISDRTADSVYDIYAYDAFWSIVLALDGVLPILENNTECMEFDQCESSAFFNSLLNCSTTKGGAIRSEVDRLSFLGKSGNVSFENGTRVLDHVKVLQYRKDGLVERVEVARISADGSQFEYCKNESESTVWPEGIPPDGTPLRATNYILTPIIAVVYTCAICCIIFAVVCFTFNYKFRERKLIRLTSPLLNYIIAVGAVLMCLAVLTFSYPPRLPLVGYDVLCSVGLYLACFGYDLCFGTISAKMLRVYYIFHNPHIAKKRVWKDWHLMIVVLVFVLIDAITLTVVTSLPTERDVATPVEDKQNPSSINERGVRVNNFVLLCDSKSTLYWLSVIYGYKAVLQVVAVILAIRIRKVKIKGLNDAKEVKRITYIVTVILLAIVVIDFVYEEYLNVHAAVLGFGLIAAASVVLGFLFIPKMVGLYHDPKGKKIFQAAACSSVNVIANSASTNEENTVSTMADLAKRIQELEVQIAHYSSKENTVKDRKL